MPKRQYRTAAAARRVSPQPGLQQSSVEEAAPLGALRRPVVAGATLAPDDVSLGYLIRHVFRAMNRIMSSSLEPFNITVAQYTILRVLWDRDGLTQREISEQIGTIDATTFAAIRGMRARGLVRQERSSVDARKVHLFLTEEAWKLEQQLRPMAKLITKRGMRGLSGTQGEELKSMLLHVLANLVEATEISLPPS
jgi:MarR family transcriptional regulator, organic hydroperoxide resistance regulator